MLKKELKMTFLGIKVNKVARVHEHQKIKVRQKDRWMNFVIK